MLYRVEYLDQESRVAGIQFLNARDDAEAIVVSRTRCWTGVGQGYHVWNANRCFHFESFACALPLAAITDRTSECSVLNLAEKGNHHA